MAFVAVVVSVNVAVAVAVVVSVADVVAVGFKQARVSSELAALAAAFEARLNSKQVLYALIPCKLRQGGR